MGTTMVNSGKWRARRIRHSGELSMNEYEREDREVTAREYIC